MNEFKVNHPFRQANFEDTVFIARLLRELYTKAGRAYGGIRYDHETTLITIEDAIRRGLCIVGPTSCAAAFLEPFANNCDHLIGVVKFWYFQKPREIRIFEEIMRLCKEQGATEISGASHAPDHVIGRYYAKLGLAPAELVYVGNIENCCKAHPERVRAA